MYKTDVLTRCADRLKEAAISPRIFSRDSLKECFRVASRHASPIVVRVDVHQFDVKEIAKLAEFLEKIFPNTQISLMAEGIKSYEEAVIAIMAGCGGIAIDDSLPLTNPENLLEIKEFSRVARALDVSIQASVGDVKNLVDGKGYQLVKAGHVDMLKLMIGNLNADNLEEYKHIIHILRKETLVTLTLGEDTYVDPKQIKILAESGISKFDVYSDYAVACVEKLADTYDKELVKDKKLFMLELQELLNGTFEQKLDYLVHRAGHFIKR